jgi:hypothetical protein
MNDDKTTRANVEMDVGHRSCGRTAEVFKRVRLCERAEQSWGPERHVIRAPCDYEDSSKRSIKCQSILQMYEWCDAEKRAARRQGVEPVSLSLYL